VSGETLLALADKVEAIRSGFDNAIDVQCEIALFEPDDCELAIRANDAGTKVIVTIAGGRDRTFLARDYTISAGARRKTAAALRARAHQETSNVG
jgi:hypothetical protein